MEEGQWTGGATGEASGGGEEYNVDNDAIVRWRRMNGLPNGAAVVAQSG